LLTRCSQTHVVKPTITKKTTTKPTTTKAPVVVAKPTTSKKATATSAAAVGSLTTGAFKDVVLNNHNVHRTNNSVGAMVYNNTIGGYAATVAGSCKYAHDL
jgi:uncharacterized protein YkwD